ncbi:DUF3533 domain-containing protein [Nonomuraea sp. NPDC050451]|uniref:DUF3533 domain-containing protein n=1 Tax=Nonomuraea sp. NPDC050451 TaxID=3364364 RepID=UPI0037A017C8
MRKSTASGDMIDWKSMDEKEVKEQLGEGKLYGALVVPGNFTSSITALTSAAGAESPVRPTLRVLTNQSAGSMGSSLARAASTAAAQSASLQVGRELAAQMGAAQMGAEQAKLPAAARILLADPAAVTVQDGHPLDSHSGLGLTAFYYALVLVVCALLSANVISGQVDHALGYTHNDMGPLRLHRPLIRATRVQTDPGHQLRADDRPVSADGHHGHGGRGRHHGHGRLPPAAAVAVLGVRHRGLRDRRARPSCRVRHARHVGGRVGLYRDGGADGRCHHPPSRRCPASTASSRSSSRCGRSPAVSARSSTTTPRATRG